MRGYRAVVDDAPAAGGLGLHQLDCVVSAQERTGEVGVDRALPAGQGNLVNRAGRAEHASVVDKQVNPLPSLLDGTE